MKKIACVSKPHAITWFVLTIFSGAAIRDAERGLKLQACKVSFYFKKK